MRLWPRKVRFRNTKKSTRFFESTFFQEFMKKAEQVKNDNIQLAKENSELKAKILELESKLKN